MWLAKPPYGTPLNPAHPLVQGLKGFYALNEGGGPTAWDSTRNLNLAATGFGSSNPWGAASQAAVVNNTQGAYFGSLFPSSLWITSSVWFACAFRITSNTQADAIPFGITYNSLFSFGLYTGTVPTCTVRAQMGGSNYIIGGPTISVGADHVFGMNIASGLQSLYLDGVLVSTNNKTGAIQYNSGSTLIVGDQPGVNTTPYMTSYWAAYGSGVQPGSVHAAIGCNINAIWQVFVDEDDEPIYSASPFAMPAMSCLSTP